MEKAVLQPNYRPTLIGGAGRSGKTLLSLALADAGGPLTGFPLEGVFHVYHKRWFPYFSSQRARIIREYLTRPRYITGDRNKVARPIDYMTQTAETLVDAVPESINNQISLIGWLLDRFSESMQQQSWAVFDLHPEFFFSTYRRFIPNLRLAVMHRKPHSAIAAGLFWRTWPNPAADRRKRFLLLLALWHLSKVVSISLARTYPESVARFSFDLLCDGDNDEHLRISKFFSLPPSKLKRDFNLIPHFSLNSDYGFLGPDNTWKKLLNTTELEQINELENGIISDRYIRSLLAFGVQAPVLTRHLIDGYLYPAKTTRRNWNSIKQLVSDARAGLQLRFLE